MNSLDLQKVVEYVNDNINDFHATKAKLLAEINLKSILRKKNPYLFRAKNITVASDLIQSILDAYLYASEEKVFGDFLENLAVFISQETCNGRKSAATGVDLEFVNNEIHYLVSIKSGPNWGNSSQQNQLQHDLQKAVQVLKQSIHTTNVQPVLGICYGKTKTTFLRGYMKVVGQNFWYLISGNENLYTDIVEPLGYRAKEHNESFADNKAALINRFTSEFTKDFCDSEGNIDWKKLVVFNSGNFAN
jgi:type II restriction endonuclease EcoO109I-like protein